MKHQDSSIKRALYYTGKCSSQNLSSEMPHSKRIKKVYGADRGISRQVSESDFVTITMVADSETGCDIFFYLYASI